MKKFIALFICKIIELMFRVRVFINANAAYAVVAKPGHFYDHFGTDVLGMDTGLDVFKAAGLDIDLVMLDVVLKQSTPFGDTFASPEHPLKVLCSFKLSEGTKVLNLSKAFSEKYTPLPHKELAEFCDTFKAHGYKYVRAGFTRGGFDEHSKMFVLMQGEPRSIMGDEFLTNVMVINSFDGSVPLSVYFLPERASNSAIVMMDAFGVESQYKTRHFPILESKMSMVSEIVAQYELTLDKLERFLKVAGSITMTDSEFFNMVSGLWPVDDLKKDRENLEIRQDLFRSYSETYLTGYEGTLLKAVYAAFGANTHKTYMKESKATPIEYRFLQDIEKNNNGHAKKVIDHLIKTFPMEFSEFN